MDKLTKSRIKKFQELKELIENSTDNKGGSSKLITTWRDLLLS